MVPRWTRETHLTDTQVHVLEAIRACPRHFSPEDILTVLRRRKIRISRSTVYRAMEQLIQRGIVKRHCLDQNTFLYELMENRHHHDHMVCIRCGTMIEFVHPDIERRQEEICRRYRFHAVTHTMFLFGFCADCQE